MFCEVVFDVKQNLKISIKSQLDDVSIKERKQKSGRGIFSAVWY